MKILANDSYWTLTTPDAGCPALTESHEVDVAIIGGGLTGLHTALKVLEDDPGKDVALIDADRICGDASGRTMGKVTTSHSKVFTHFSADEGKAYVKADAEGFERILSLIEAYGIDCDLRRVANYVFASTDSQVDHVEKDYESMVRSGLDVEWVEPRNSESREVPLGFIAGIRQAEQAVYHPRKFALGLLEAIQGLGGSVYEHTLASGLVEHSEGVDIGIGDGNVLKARKAVVATRIGLSDDEPFLDSMRFWRGHQSAFAFGKRPIENAYIRYEPPVMSFRADKEYLLIGGRDGESLPFEDGSHYRAIDSWVKQAYPEQKAAKEEKKACFWWGEDAESADMLPLIGGYRKDSRHTFLASGFCGWGMTKSAFAGIMLADLVAGRGSPYQECFDPWRF